MIAIALSAPATLAAAYDPTDTLEYQQRSKGMPDDVRAFLAQAIECHYWRNEPAYDKDRAKFIRAVMQKRGCGKVNRVAKLLRAKYKRKPQIVAVISSAKDDFR